MSTVSDRRRREAHRKQIDELAAALRRLGGSLLLHHQGQAERLGLNATDARAMSLLTETGPVPAGRLAELMSLTTGAITGLLDRLEAVGLVRRESDPEDRRKVLVVPTGGADAQEVQRLFGPLARPFARFVRSYEEDELALIIDFVSRTSELLRSEVDAPSSANGGGSATDRDARGDAAATNADARTVSRDAAGRRPAGANADED